MNTEIAGKSVKTKNKQEAPVTGGKPQVVALKTSSGHGVRGHGLASKIAESDLSSRNFKFKDAETHFPLRPTWRTVDRYFPNAKGGPLLVDEPEDKADIDACAEKAKVLKKLGYRYVYLTKETDEYAARQMLGET